MQMCKNKIHAENIFNNETNHNKINDNLRIFSIKQIVKVVEKFNDDKYLRTKVFIVKVMKKK